MSSFSDYTASVTKFFDTGYIGFFDCQFSNPNWFTCLSSGRILPQAFLFGVFALIKLITTQWGFLATSDTPTIELKEEEFGVVNVRPIYYVLDTIFELFWDTIEATFGTILLLFFASGIFAWNSGVNTFYTYVAVAQIFALVFHIFAVSIKLLYGAVNIDYLLRVYDTSTYTEMQFYTPANFIMSGKDQLGLVLFAEQLLLGNKRLGMYNNIFLSIVLALHPISFIFSWWYLFQVPANILLDVFIFPWFPQFDTPQIDWQWYWAEVSYWTNGPESQYQQNGKKTDRDIQRGTDTDSSTQAIQQLDNIQ